MFPNEIKKRALFFQVTIPRFETETGPRFQTSCYSCLPAMNDFKIHKFCKPVLVSPLIFILTIKDKNRIYFELDVVHELDHLEFANWTKDWVNLTGFGFFRVFSGQGLEDHFNIGSDWVQALQKSLGYFNSGYREKETFGFFRVFSGWKVENPICFLP